MTISTLARMHTQTLFYGCAMILFALMSIQNARYGSYNLSFAGLFVIPILACALALTWFTQASSQAWPGHALALAAIGLLALALIGTEGPLAAHWLCLTGSVAWLVLPLRPAAVVNASCGLFGTLALLMIAAAERSMLFFSTFVLLNGTLGIWAWLHYHKSRFLVEEGVRDPTTGVFNLRQWDYTLHEELARSRMNEHRLSLLALEIDFFDQILEVHGQNGSNEMLAQLGNHFLALSRAGDSIYYAGQGRFLFLLPSTAEEGLLVYAERLRRDLSEGSWATVESLSASLGCMSCAPGSGVANELTQKMLDALKSAQKSGRDRVVLAK